MPQLLIENLENRLLKTDKTTGKVIELIHENGIDWMHACGKKGRCTTCKLIITSGMENLSEPSEHEIRFFRQGRLSSRERLTCQAVLCQGEVVGRVADINKFPHLLYSE